MESQKVSAMNKQEKKTKRRRRPIPLAGDFWRTPTLDELAKAQGVKPVTDFNALLGGWPKDELDDGFEEAIERMRGHESGRRK